MSSGDPTQAVVFCFDSEAPGVSSYYGGEFDPAFLAALSSSDPQGTTRSCVLRGDALIEMLCTRVRAVEQTGQGQSWTQGYDMELYKTVIWDLVDAFGEQWHTIDLEKLSVLLTRSRIHCIALPTLEPLMKSAIDQALIATNGYIGAVVLDLGNPLQRRIFIDHLVKDAFIKNGSVHLERGLDGEENTLFEEADSFKPNGLRRLEFEDFHRSMPPIPKTALSERGRASAERFEGKSVYTLEERVLHALAFLDDPGKAPFAFKQGDNAACILEAELPQAKFVQYLLNPDHKDGAGKAKFFHDVLGIGMRDWRFLAEQFYTGLRESKLSGLQVKTWKDGFGASFNCTIRITGLNGRTANVFTNWIMHPGLIPQLSTAVPVPSDASIDAPEIDSSSIVPSSFSGEKRWIELYRLADEAGRDAAELFVPTPMKVVGFDVEMEGMCGSASIRVPDARRGFAKWLLKSQKGDRHYKSGASVYSSWPTQSLDRAVAYARAFAAVLTMNGIACTVGTYID